MKDSIRRKLEKLDERFEESAGSVRARGHRRARINFANSRWNTRGWGRWSTGIADFSPSKAIRDRARAGDGG